MLKDMEKLMAKKGENKMSPEDLAAKMDVLKELLEMASAAMGSKVKDGMDEMRKVSVMAPDKESLAEGLDLAKDMTQESPEMEESEEEMSEKPSMESKSEEPEKKDDEESDDDSLFGKRPKKNTTSSFMYDDE